MLRQSERFGPRRLPAVDLEDVIASPADLDSIEAIELPPQPIDLLAQFLHLDVDEGEIEHAIEACKIDRLRAASSKRGEDAAGFFRKGGSGHGISRYSADEIATIEAELGELMAKFGYKIPSKELMTTGFAPVPRF